MKPFFYLLKHTKCPKIFTLKFDFADSQTAPNRFEAHTVTVTFMSVSDVTCGNQEACGGKHMTGFTGQ